MLCAHTPYIYVLYRTYMYSTLYTHTHYIYTHVCIYIYIKYISPPSYMCSISYTHIHTHTHARMGPMDTPFPPSFLISPPPLFCSYWIWVRRSICIYTHIHTIYTHYIYTHVLYSILYIYLHLPVPCKNNLKVIYE